MANFYPRSPCGERRTKGDEIQALLQISIHALLAESDLPRLTLVKRLGISIHALLAESDSVSFIVFPFQLQFLSTLSLRRATSAFLF